LLTLGFGAEDNDYTRAVSRNFLVSMIARAMRPGCQVDTLPILEGEQGIGKSQGLAALAGQFYADIDTAIGTREFAEQVQGKWLVELSELSAMRPSEVEKVKSGITRTVDVYREPFAILASDHPRQCVFAGTTNAQHYLHDSTGNRRFWPVRCGVIDREWIKANREQLFAEALHLYATGTTWWDMPGDTAKVETEKRLFGDALQDRVQAYLDLHGTNVRVNEILEAWDVPEAQWSAPLQRRIADALKALGWYSVKSNGRQVWRQPTGQITPDPFNVTPITGAIKQVRRL
jgi:predicted P-loop ATPase